MEKTVSILTGKLLSCASKRWEKIQTQNINHRLLPIIVRLWLAVQLHSCGFSMSKLRDKHPCCLQVDLQTCLARAFQRVLGVPWKTLENCAISPLGKAVSLPQKPSVYLLFSQRNFDLKLSSSKSSAAQQKKQQLCFAASILNATTRQEDLDLIYCTDSSQQLNLELPFNQQSVIFCYLLQANGNNSILLLRNSVKLLHQL